MSAAPQGTHLRVCLPVPAHAIMAHLLLTDSLGYAEDEGLRLSFHIVDGPDTAIGGVGDGDFDMAVGNAVFAFRMRERGAPVRAFYSTCRRVYRSFAVPVDSPIQKVPDLRGRCIGTDFPDLLDLAFPVLRDEGLDPEHDVTFLPRSIPIPGVAPKPEEIERITTGQLDAIWVLACAYEMLRAEGAQLRRLPTRTLDRLTPSELLYTSERLLDETPEAVAGFGRAVAKASVFCDANPEAAVRLVWQHFPEAGPAPGDEEQALKRDAAGLRGRTERGLPQHGRIPLWGSITTEEVQEWEDFLLRNGGIRQRRPFEEYYAQGLAEAFNRFDPDEVRARAAAH
jgi:NitT/TauT family transport system substrate-binding protein